MAYFFTWRDIEKVFEENRITWPSQWNNVRVYSDSVVVYHKQGEFTESEKVYLKELFKRNYNQQDNKILVDFTQVWLEVVCEADEDEKREKKYSPLFRDMYFSDTRQISQMPELPGARILAFHSYKGGVGRTLSLISLVRECTETYPDKKILIIDADVEAPGLTWMAGEEYRRISYLDILSLMNFEKMTEDKIDKMAELVKTSQITFVTDKSGLEQYFIPVYREKAQVMDAFSNPERILLAKTNKFLITETISSLGKALGVDLIFVDLRAGITEYSAPFLFDPRVEKYYVTSTSLQSIKGLNQILEQIYKKTESELLKAKILLTMIPSNMKEEQIREIEDRIIDKIETRFDLEESTFLRDNYFLEFGFDEALIHVDDLSSLCSNLKNKEITTIMKKQAELLITAGSHDFFYESEAREILSRIHDIARNETTAEGSAGANMLVTSSIKEITRIFERELPRIVVSGAKGSGKTYLYKQLLLSKEWKHFLSLTRGNTETAENNAVIIPLLSTLNVPKMKDSLSECLAHANMQLDGLEIRKTSSGDNFSILQKKLEDGKETTRSEWVENWKETILRSVGNTFSQLSDLDVYLQEHGKRIVFIIDGLEDLCMDAQLAKNDNWKYVLRALCQNVINELGNLDYGNIGLIVFARKDMIADAIETNTEQFKSLYQKYELNWSQTEALRLALWLVARAYPEIANGVDVLTATKDVLVDKLVRLWGLKLGRSDSREAFSDRWIVAALSDFSGQLQARDIVRFLKYSTEYYKDTKLIYKDRLIMPLDIRNAINPCSEEKLSEIKSEMKNIYDILNKFLCMDENKKTLPLTLDKINLTGDEIAKLEAQGFLKISDKKYYLPEIIRLALGFKYDKGARPKVLSLLVQ